MIAEVFALCVPFVLVDRLEVEGECPIRVVIDNNSIPFTHSCNRIWVSLKKAFLNNFSSSAWRGLISRKRAVIGIIHTVSVLIASMAASIIFLSAGTRRSDFLLCIVFGIQFLAVGFDCVYLLSMVAGVVMGIGGCHEKGRFSTSLYWKYGPCVFQWYKSWFPAVLFVSGSLVQPLLSFQRPFSLGRGEL